MSLDAKPATDKRAESIPDFYRKLSLCSDPTCLLGGSYFVEGAIFCGRHAGPAALSILLLEPKQ